MTRPLTDLERGTIVVLPSATFPESELRKIVAIQHYEERLLCTTLLLADPELQIVYITSLPVDEAIVEYYLHFLPDPANARRCLHFVVVGEDSGRALTAKVLDAPHVIERGRRRARRRGRPSLGRRDRSRHRRAAGPTVQRPSGRDEAQRRLLGSGQRNRRARRVLVARRGGRDVLCRRRVVAVLLGQGRDRRRGGGGVGSRPGRRVAQRAATNNARRRDRGAL